MLLKGQLRTDPDKLPTKLSTRIVETYRRLEQLHPQMSTEVS